MKRKAGVRCQVWGFTRYPKPVTRNRSYLFPDTRHPGGEGNGVLDRLSVCLIVRDGAQTLDACLESVKDLADEIVVVDTGSGDGTVEIARRHGAKIGHFTWCDDFAAARNASLRLATGDWTLWMDADDILPREAHDQVRQAMARGRQEAFYFTLENVGADRSRYPQLRLFPNVPGAAFERTVHEQIAPSLERLGIACVRTDIRVVHTGYTTPERTSEKRRKYLGMMRQWLETHPEDADIRFRVAHTLYGEGDLEAAGAEFRALVSDESLKARRPSVARMARTFLGRVRMDRGHHAEALSPLQESVALSPDASLARLYLGECCLALGQPEAAQEHLAHALTHEDGEPFFPLDRAAFRVECEKLMERCEAEGREQRAESEPSPRLAPLGFPSPACGRGVAHIVSRGEGLPRSPIPDPRSLAGGGGGGRLSLAMIVRNEEARLGRCLESVQGLVDEIVVVDTGSTDRTVEVARGYGAKIHFFEWCEDFSAARNEAIRHATGDWIMWLDADDLFPEENFPKVRKALEMGRGHAFYFRLQDEGYDATTCLQLRLFPNLPGVKFEMPVHEQVALSLNRLGVRILPTDIVVRHTGYTTEEVVKAKQRRYFNIMQRWLEQHPDDYIVRHHEAQTHYIWGEMDEAIADYRRILEEGRAASDRNLIIVTTAHLYLGRSLMRKGEHEQALGPLHEALKMDDRYAVTHLTLGECYLRLNRLDESIRHLELAQQHEDQVTFAPNDPRKVKSLIRLFLGHVHEAKGDPQEAVRRYEASAAVGGAEALGPLSTALRKLGRREEAQRTLEQASERDPDNPHHPFNLGVMALEAGDLDRAEQRFVQATQRGDGVPQAFLNLGFIQKKRGDFGRAEEMYRRALERMEDTSEAHANLGHLHLSLKRYREAAQAFRKVREKKPDLLDINLGLALASAHEGDATAVREMLERVLRATCGDALTDDPPAVLPPPDTAQLFAEMGRMLVGRGQPRCAEFAFETAWTLDPTFRTAALSLAEVLRHQGEFWRAVEVYEGLIRTAPEDADLFRRLGACYRQFGSDAAAQACEQQATMIEQGKASVPLPGE
ncbi:MAG: glycosyltransferase [Candidatus Latescibacteria bacterium]|nr:glycosyltransferase [Candidatus Latescibacterota bacterium]